MDAPTVCILTAGKGTRMGALGSGLNKALLPLGQEAVISHIIKRFPPEAEFVIALGYHGAQVRAYLSAAHPAGRLHFVEVDRYEGSGSGPGYSLSLCEPLLQKPFFFVSCDTLWDGDIPFNADRNWFGTAVVPPEEAPSYCNFALAAATADSAPLILDIFDKTTPPACRAEAFIGLCFIHDYGAFWPSLKKDILVGGEHQISNGIRALVENKTAEARTLEWTDLGTEARFHKAAAKFQEYDFSKVGEFLYIVNGRVVKFFENASIVQKRVARARLNPSVFPEIAFCSGQFYAYDFVPGKTLYQENSPAIFRKLLSWLEQNLWKAEGVTAAGFEAHCEAFYRAKTFERIAFYHQKYPGSDVASVINGESVASVSSLLGGVPWPRLLNGRSTFFHGDLQFDNIIYDRAGDAFLLLDWRQDFGGDVNSGDQYYDLAKLNGGILLAYDFIKKGLFAYEESGAEITFDFASRHLAGEYFGILRAFVQEQGLDWERVNLMTALIFLNMAPLHHYPFDKLLYALGRQSLQGALHESAR